MIVAGRLHQLPEKKIAKCIMCGLKPDVFREEIYSRTLDDVTRDAREVLTTYHHILEMSDRIKKEEPGRIFLKGKVFRQWNSNFKKRGKNISGGVSRKFQETRE